jgi:mannose-1-phosphate guanylyltransferase/phosphomannomutase
MALAEQDGTGLAFAGGADYEVIFPEFQPAFDGLYGAAKVMELLAAEHQPASELVDQLPDWHMASRAVPCPWDRKGLVMRALHDESRNGDGVQTIDGIRISENGGWVLVLPDASEATVNVIAESTSDESADHTAANMANRIAHLIASG